MIDVLFFARLREQLRCDHLQLPPDTARSVAELQQSLYRQHPGWETVLSRPGILVAVNQQIADQQAPLQDRDEVAFFPPVTGG